jgi:hypothetical protein
MNAPVDQNVSGLTPIPPVKERHRFHTPAFAIPITSFFAGLSAPLFLLPLWISPFLDAAKKGNPADWIGFAGNFGAGIMTLIAAALAWLTVQSQIQDQRRAAEIAENSRLAALQQTQVEAKLSAASILSEPAEAAAALLYSMKRALAATDVNDMQKWDDAVEKACSWLGTSLQGFGLHAFTSDLSWEDRRQYVKVLGILSSFHIFSSKRPDTFTRTRFLEVAIDESTKVLQTGLSAFASDLGEAFVKNSTID